jgi:hypothetical protein
MAHKVFDLAQQLTTSTGTGAVTLGAVPAGMLGFADQGAVAADTFWGCIRHTTANEVEITLCTIVGDGTITRAATPLASTTGAKIAFSAGTKTISCVAPASKSAIADANGQIVFPGPVVTNGQRETVAAPAISAGALSLDLKAATVFIVALNANVTAMTFANMVPGFAASFLLEFTADGTARTVAQPASVVAMNGAYTPSSINGKKDRLLYETIDGGTTWRMWIVFLNQ